MMIEKKQKKDKKKRKRGRPEKIITGIPASLEDLGKAMFAPVREPNTKTDQQVQEPEKAN